MTRPASPPNNRQLDNRLSVLERKGLGSGGAGPPGADGAPGAPGTDGHDGAPGAVGPSSAIVLRGVWTAGQAYSATNGTTRPDAVGGSDGGMYFCKVDHTSSAAGAGGDEPGVGASWTTKWDRPVNAGKSDYDLWLDNGNVGTVTDMLNSRIGAAADASGWFPDAHTWTYVSGAATNMAVIEISGDATGYVGLYDRVRFKQGGAYKYGIVMLVNPYQTPTAGKTRVFVFAGTTSGFQVANAAITDTYFSHAKTPVGFDATPNLWTIEGPAFFDTPKGSPVAFQWYSVADSIGAAIAVPVGTWRVEYDANIQVDPTSTQATVEAGLSTSNGGAGIFVDPRSVCVFGNNVAVGATDAAPMYGPARRGIYVTLAAAATYYLNVRTISTGVNTIYCLGGHGYTIIRAFPAGL